MTRKSPEAKLFQGHLPRAALGEGPYWCAGEQAIYWVDIDGFLLHRHSVSDGYHAYPMPTTVSFALHADDGRLAVGLADGVYLFDRQTSLLTPYALPANMPQGNRFNDAKCDPVGRLWAGTISQARKPEAALYCLRGEDLAAHETGIVNSNGLGWSPDGRTMYFNDTAQRTTWAYDYDVETGAAINRRVFINHGEDGRPDGLCVDSMGHLYCASYSQGAVDMFTPDGRHLNRISVPADHVTSCAFGGADMCRLFITTAGDSGDSGGLFFWDADIAGIAEVPLRLKSPV